jgi:ABC-2 type transport system ATP-binding protein
VEEGRAELGRSLAARGLQVREDGRFVLVALEDGRPYDLVRDAIADLGLALVRLEQRRHSLEDLFRDDEQTVEARQ